MLGYSYKIDDRMDDRRESVEWSSEIAGEAGGGKAVGIQKLLDRYSLRREECMAFGDRGQ